jgi:hypothetical protein
MRRANSQRLISTLLDDTLQFIERPVVTENFLLVALGIGILNPSSVPSLK